jgi:zinc transport system substrate-binding protein
VDRPEAARQARRDAGVRRWLAAHHDGGVVKWLLAIALVVTACAKKSADPTPAPAPPVTAGTGPLRVGVTLHPYYSWVANVIAGVPGADVVPVLPGEIDAGNYQPSPDDIGKLAKLDAIVINGIGHDDFIRDMIKASGNTQLVVIEANAQTPLVRSAHGDASNSHTFISFTNAIQQSRLIAKQLGALRPASADAFAANASAYADKLRAIQSAAAAQLAHAKIKRVVTVHDGYTYLLQEFGIELAGVVQPAHGLTPSAKELGDMIELMKREKITTVLSEEDFPDKLLATLRDATQAKVYIISHVAVGGYSPTEFETVMQTNADTLVKALVTDP